MPSTAPSFAGFSGMALASATLCSPSAAFVTPSAVHKRAVSASTAPPAERLQQQPEFGATAGLATAACALAVAGGTAKLL
eukprot:CAMPEP_0185908846 /NCGR_PEP_ID=MMETSP0196C-20130402/9831_1 /TAXON_ID=2932 /ORGANISM="Alexandrium fundyense, Strain CCMP1719" /LENGTH=79 /DNA_ID=CAMNT_0028629187 /DNA_START=81 /DNA_END=316 /DNA_ORIENTATION=-